MQAVSRVQTGKVFTIQELLGHADLASTRIYAHCSNERLRQAVERIRPAEKQGGELSK
ncbi:MAG: hypothetical protein ACPLPT_10050 [Moorellales bacterium]